ncbi:MAG: hypothetical protein SGILL_007779 [Bacillariaceae sp.]
MTLDQEVADAIDMAFVLICGFLCFLLQAGFGLLEVGSVRKKNAQNIMMKNILDAVVTAIAYFAFGYAFAYGESENGFIGNSYYFLIGTEDYINWFFQYVFAGTVATIVSGAVAERLRFRSYLVYSFVLSGFVYPVVCHWIWDPNGFLYGKVLDFSGSGAVHLVGGAAAMSGAWVLGPRIGKFIVDPETGKKTPRDIPGWNKVLASLGTLILWFGFFPFNAGAGYSIANPEAAVNTGRAVVVTCLAGASGSLTMLLYGIVRFRQWDLNLAMNGLLAGMVASCSGVNVYEPYIALTCVGTLGAVFFQVQDYLFEYVLFIDDPLKASSLHMGAGVAGLLCVGFFADPKYVDNDENVMGIVFGGNGQQLGFQLYGMVVYFAWAFGTSTIMFWGLRLIGWLRVSEEVEKIGLDSHHHGGSALPRMSRSFQRKDTSLSEASNLESATGAAHDFDSLEEGDISAAAVKRSSHFRQRPNALLAGQV